MEVFISSVGVSEVDAVLAEGRGGVMMAYFVESFWVGKCRGWNG